MPPELDRGQIEVPAISPSRTAPRPSDPLSSKSPVHVPRAWGYNHRRMTLPPSLLKPRALHPGVYDQALASGIHPVAARVLAGRRLPASATANLPSFLRPGPAQLDAPGSMRDMGRAAQAVADAVMQGWAFFVETDFDADGQSSHAVLHTALVRHFGVPAARVRSYISHRLKEGYGLTAPLAERMIQDADTLTAPILVITADNGSSDEAQIALLHAAGLRVIVTDHHSLPEEGPPASAFAVVNPSRNDCPFPDKAIAGCMVAWYLMMAVRAELIRRGHLPADTPKLSGLLDYVAVGTVADCVSLASVNNRIVVNRGLELINAPRALPAWLAVRPLANGPVNAEDLAFRVAPMLNAASRVADVDDGLSFLLATDRGQAVRWMERLTSANQERKAIERDMTEIALALVAPQIAAGRLGALAFHPDFHPGVVGICASRIKERTGRPAGVFAPKASDSALLTGSFRTIDYAPFHVRDALQWIADHHPGILLRFGGHAGAAGATLARERLPDFERAWEAAVGQQITEAHPVILTDGALRGAEIDLALFATIEGLAPFGKGFERPVFELEARVEAATPRGDGTHLKLRLEADGNRLEAIWFRARPSPDVDLPVAPGDAARFAVTLGLNRWNGSETLQLIVSAAEGV